GTERGSPSRPPRGPSAPGSVFPGAPSSLPSAPVPSAPIPVPSYRCFKAVMFLSGLLFGSGVIFALCYGQRVLGARLGLAASAGIALPIGLLCGLLTALLRSVGLFTTGLLLGLLLAAAALAVAAPVPPPSPWVPVSTALALALLCALLALRWPKAVTVAATAALGAAAVLVGADYFAEALALVLFVCDRLRRAPAPALCWPGWALLGAWPLLSFLAALLQWRITARGCAHSAGERGTRCPGGLGRGRARGRWDGNGMKMEMRCGQDGMGTGVGTGWGWSRMGKGLRWDEDGVRMAKGLGWELGRGWKLGCRWD
uniref:Transmembrane protein 198 n=1 Tax=Strigops habroptila TaxID=2489341 RepID=A0A672UGL5_STRHB